MRRHGSAVRVGAAARRTVMVVGVVAVLAPFVPGSPAAAQDDTSSTVPPTVPTSEPSSDDGDPGTVTGGTGGETTPATLPLIPLPVGCEAPVMPHIVFLGTVTESDFRTVRYEIDTVRSGTGAPFADDGEIDVRYGLDAKFVEHGEQYLVSAVVDPDLGLLVSRVSEPIEDFGGDEVIGVSETDVNCPKIDDPMRTMYPDGTQIETSVIAPFLDAKARIAGAFLLPFGVAMGVIFALATLRLSVSGIYRGVADATSRHRHRRRSLS